MSIPNWKKRWRKKVKREFKRAIKVEGFEGWFVIIGESLTGKECELPRIRNARLRVGLHPLWGALPPRRVHAAPTPAYTSIQGYSGATFSLHTRQPTYPPLAVGIAGWSLLFTPAIGGYVKLLILKQNFNLSIAKNCLRRRAVSPHHR